jgi:hypothetical protein
VRVNPPSPDLSDHLDFTVDPDAEPSDIDDALAEFLIAFHRSTLDASEGSDRKFPEATERWQA